MGAYNKLMFTGLMITGLMITGQEAANHQFQIPAHSRIHGTIRRPLHTDRAMLKLGVHYKLSHATIRGPLLTVMLQLLKQMQDSSLLLPFGHEVKLHSDPYQCCVNKSGQCQGPATQQQRSNT
jgi:hypothetical protein